MLFNISFTTTFFTYSVPYFISFILHIIINTLLRRRFRFLRSPLYSTGRNFVKQLQKAFSVIKEMNGKSNLLKFVLYLRSEFEFLSSSRAIMLLQTISSPELKFRELKSSISTRLGFSKLNYIILLLKKKDPSCLFFSWGSKSCF